MPQLDEQRTKSAPPSSSQLLLIGGERIHPSEAIHESALRHINWGPNPVHTIMNVDWSGCALLCLHGPLDAAVIDALQRCLSALNYQPVVLWHGSQQAAPPTALTAVLRYHNQQSLAADTLQTLIERLWHQPKHQHPLSATQQEQVFRLAERIGHCEHWYQALSVLLAGSQRLLDCDRCDVLLWQHHDDEAAFNEAIVFCQQHQGLATYSQTTGLSINASALDQDPRFDAQFDLPQQRDPGTVQDHALLLLPLLKQPLGPGVLRCYRTGKTKPHQASFSVAEQRRMEALLDATGDALRRQWLLHARPDHVSLSEESPALNNPIYRREALQEFMQGEQEDGGILLQDDHMSRWTYWILLAGLLLMAAYLWFGTVHEYANGPAIVNSSGRSQLTALNTGTVSEVLVEPGAEVQAGQALLTLHQGRELAELQRLQQEFDARLRQRLLNPDDVQIEAVLINLRSELELARSLLEERTITAPQSGLVGDIRVRAGQFVGAGQSLITLSHNDESQHLLALIPGRFRPQLAVGMPLRMELVGYPYDYQHLTITKIDQQAIGPQQARLYLGSSIADALTIEGPVVLVQAALPDDFTTRNGESYRYHEGMAGRIEIRLRSEPIVERLLPGLKLLRGQHE